MFYKIVVPETNEITGGDYIIGPGYELVLERHQEYTYPVDGWVYAETEEEALILLGANNGL